VSWSEAQRRDLAERLARDLPRAERDEALARLADLDRAAELFEQAGERERARDMSAAAPPAAGEERALAGLERAMAAAPSARRLSPALVLALAAAAVLALIALWRGLTRPPEPERLFVGESATCVAPAGEVDDFATFHWEAQLPPAGYYQIAVWAASDPPSAAPRIVSERLDQPSWTPDPEQASALPDAIRWQVRVYDANRVQVDAASQSARRSSR
jgi:hypothetical protein